MKVCPKCGAQMDDAAMFCVQCGASFAGAPAPAPAPAIPAYDHTAEFEAEDISKHKVYAMLVYLAGIFGIIIALLAAKESEYVMFHVKQAMKLWVCELLVAAATALLFWTCIMLLAGPVLICILTVLQIIAFFQVCGGKAKEPAIVRSLSFFN